MTATRLEERQHAMDEAIAELQAQGQPVTNEAVRAMTGIGRNTVKRYLKQWRAQQRADRPPVAPAPAVVTPASQAPRPASLPYLQALGQQRIEDRAIREDLRRELVQHEQDAAERDSLYRAGVLEAQRLTPLFLRAYQASRLAIYRGDAGVQEEYQRLRSQLVALVGEEDVQRLETDPAFRAWWLSPEHGR